MTVAVAYDYGLAVRVYGEALTTGLQARGYPTLDNELLDSYGLEPDAKPAIYARLLQELPAGLSEWAVHPGLDSRELRAIEPGSPVRPVRPTDYAFFASSAARAIIDAEGIIVLDYGALQEVWART